MTDKTLTILDRNGVIDITHGDVIIHDTLPDGTYRIKPDGYGKLHIHRSETIARPARDVSGDMARRVTKVFNRFDKRDTSLGVLMSGARGIGKTTLVKALAQACHDRGIPVLIIDKYYQGLAEYIMKLDVVCMCVFDEFEKMFTAEEQARLLTVFDGLNATKHLNVVTCNDARMLDDNMLDRPGRFFYHFRFDYPDNTQITTFLNSHGILDRNQVDSVIRFAQAKPLSYDMLTAIAEELGDSDTDFTSIIDELNIDTSTGAAAMAQILWSDGVRSLWDFRIPLSADTGIYKDSRHDVSFVLADLRADAKPKRPERGDGMVIDHDADVDPYSMETSYADYDTTIEFDMADVRPQADGLEQKVVAWCIDCSGVRLKQLYTPNGPVHITAITIARDSGRYARVRAF